MGETLVWSCESSSTAKAAFWPRLGGEGSSGSSVYAYDNSSKQRIITGVNVAESPEANTAVRLNAANVQWINSLYK